jgi:hypothetical protein
MPQPLVGKLLRKKAGAGGDGPDALRMTGAVHMPPKEKLPNREGPNSAVSFDAVRRR